MIFLRLSLPLSILLSVVSLLAVVVGEQVRVGWPMNLVTRADDGLWHFVRLDVDRGLISRLPIEHDIYDRPSLSPNGRYSVFDSPDRAVLFDLQENVERMTIPGSWRTWSPDSRYFSFASRDVLANDQYRAVMIVEIDENGIPSDPMPMTIENSDPLAGYVLWSPDSQRMAFLNYNTDGTDLLIANADGSNARLLLPTVASGQPIAWSPDSEHIAFVWYEPNNNRFPLYLSQIHVDGTGQDIIGGILPNRIATLSWSPDGRYIAYIASSFEGLYVVEVATGQLTGPIDHQLEASVMQWSPDSERLVFFSRADQHLYAVGRDGHGLRRMTPSEGFYILLPTMP